MLAEPLLLSEQRGKKRMENTEQKMIAVCSSQGSAVRSIDEGF